MVCAPIVLAGALLIAQFDPWFSSFRPLSEVDGRLDDLAAMQSRAEVVELGFSHEGRAIRALQLGTGLPERPTVVAIGTQHAREWISPMVSLCIADALTRGLTDFDPTIVHIVDRVDVVVVPVVNPDGYVYTWEVDRMWRKNRSPAGGVDLNRNWDAMWGTGVVGEPPSSDTYPGASAFSEPETVAVATLVESRATVGFLDYHAPIATVLYPFAYTSDPGPMETIEAAWAESMAAAMSDVHGHPHATGKPGVGHPSGGLAQDWAHGEVGALAWTVELRGADGVNPFVLPEAEIIPACEEAFAGFVDVAGRLADEYGEDPPAGNETGSETGDAGSTDGPTSPGSTSGSESTTDGTDDRRPTSTQGLDDPGVVPTDMATRGPAGCGCRSPGRPASPVGVAVIALWVLIGTRRRTP